MEKYYGHELHELKEQAEDCDRDIVKSLLFFLKEANGNMNGLDKDMVNEIETITKQFNKNCSCDTAL